MRIAETALMQLAPSLVRRLRRHAARPLGSWLAPLALLAPLPWPASAQADCVGPDLAITWTYPNLSALTVPPDAVFWVVSESSTISASVDGVPLTPLGTSLAGRTQFVPAEPLSEGEHEFAARAENEYAPASAGAEPYVNSDEQHIHFRVDARAAREGDVSITSVEAYELSFRGSPPKRVNPPPEEYDGACTQLAIPLGYECNDTGGPPYLARVAYDWSGAPPLAYLVQGGWLVPPGCLSFWARTESSTPEEFRVAAVLPTGLGEEHAFTGEVAVTEAEPGPYANPPSACSIQPGRRTSPSLLLAIAMLSALGVRLRRR